MIPVQYKGSSCYIVEAELIKEEKACNVVRFNGKSYRWQKSHAEIAKVYGPGKWAIRVSFYDIMYNQSKTKKIIKSMMDLFKNPLRRISVN